MEMNHSTPAKAMTVMTEFSTMSRKERVVVVEFGTSSAMR